ncbi:hypothetical protein HPP92_006357 [Vanilla planifolia]|uniref:Uncharacterized protein n=1 Tax=Vanilla planifolia TaxID=51239 RepID=A0A835RI93_VANPL|nr:hypothetical protein HPP92_006357 [Vanilla planifolia]
MDSISVANTNQHYLLSDKLLSITEEAGLSPTKRQEVHCGSGNGPFDISDVMEDKSSLLDKHDNEIEDEPAVNRKIKNKTQKIFPCFLPLAVPQFQLFQDALEQPLPFGHNHLDNNEPNVDESFKPIFNYVKYMLSKHGYDLLLCETDFVSWQLSKDDGWMNLYRDAECFGLLLEEMMLDDFGRSSRGIERVLKKGTCEGMESRGNECKLEKQIRFISVVLYISESSSMGECRAVVEIVAVAQAASAVPVAPGTLRRRSPERRTTVCKCGANCTCDPCNCK